MIGLPYTAMLTVSSQAHRGLSLMQPENTMGAFKAAVEVGADAVETDIHLTKDDAVVLSHVSTATAPTSRPYLLMTFP